MLSAYFPNTYRRLLANVLDEILMIPFYAPFFGVFLKFFWSDDEVHISLLTFGLILLVPAVYEFVFLVLMQATPAKWFLGLKVVPAVDPEMPLTWQQSLLRVFTKRLSLFLSLAIYALALFRYDRTHLADWVAETRVIQFSPRAQRPRIRWILGSLFTVYFVVEGLSAASAVVKTIDWKRGRVNLNELMSAYQLEDYDADFE